MLALLLALTVQAPDTIKVCPGSPITVGGVTRPFPNLAPGRYWDDVRGPKSYTSIVWRTVYVVLSATACADTVPTPPPPPPADTQPTPPPPPVGDVVFADGFETVVTYDDRSGTQTRSTAAARTGSYGLRVSYPSGGSGGWLTKFYPNMDSGYVEMWVRFPSTWRGHTKLLELYGGQIGNAWSAYGTAGKCPTGTDFFATALITEPGTGNPGTLRMYDYYPGMAKEPDGVTCWGRYGPWNGTTISLGTWHQLGMWVKVNTPGQANGEQRIYVDGREVAVWSGMTLRTTTGLALNSVQLTFNVSGSGSPVAQTLDVDDVKVTRTRPTTSAPPPPADTQPTPPPPPPPDTTTPPPAPANPGYPNEPSGAAVLFDWDTDFANLPAWWGYKSGTSNLSTTTDASAPVNPAKVGRVRFATGCCNGSGPARLESYPRLPSGWTQLYVSDWIKFDVSFTPHACCQKTFEFFWSSGGDKWLLVKMDPVQNNGAFPLTPRFTTEYAGSASANHGGQAIVRAGIWYQVEVIVHKTGRIQQWVREVGKSPVLMYDGTPSGAGSVSPGTLFWWWGYGGLGSYAGPTSYIYHNHMRVSVR